MRIEAEPCPYYRYIPAGAFSPAEHWCLHPESESGDCVEGGCPLSEEDLRNEEVEC